MSICRRGTSAAILKARFSPLVCDLVTWLLQLGVWRTSLKELHECRTLHVVKGQLTNIHGLPFDRSVGQRDTLISTNQAQSIDQRLWKVDIQVRRNIRCLFPPLREKRSDAGSAATQRTRTRWTSHRRKSCRLHFRWTPLPSGLLRSSRFVQACRSHRLPNLVVSRLYQRGMLIGLKDR